VCQNTTYSAAVCEVSDAWDMLLERGFELETLDACDSAMIAGRWCNVCREKRVEDEQEEKTTTRQGRDAMVLLSTRGCTPNIDG